MPMPSKGERAQHTIRVPVEHYEHYVNSAQQLGMSVGEYLVYMLAIAHEFDPNPQPHQQEELVLTDA